MVTNAQAGRRFRSKMSMLSHQCTVEFWLNPHFFHVRLGEAVLTIYVLSKNKTNINFEKFSTEIPQFLQLKKNLYITWACFRNDHSYHLKVQVGNHQEMLQSEGNSHSKHRGGKKTNLTIRYIYKVYIS